MPAAKRPGDDRAVTQRGSHPLTQTRSASPVQASALVAPGPLVVRPAFAQGVQTVLSLGPPGEYVPASHWVHAMPPYPGEHLAPAGTAGCSLKVLQACTGLRQLV